MEDNFKFENWSLENFKQEVLTEVYRYGWNTLVSRKPFLTAKDIIFLRDMKVGL